MRAIRLLPAGRALFDDLKIKPENTFDAGLFWRNRAARAAARGLDAAAGLGAPGRRQPRAERRRAGPALGARRVWASTRPRGCAPTSCSAGSARAARCGSGASAHRRSTWRRADAAPGGAGRDAAAAACAAGLGRHRPPRPLRDGRRACRAGAGAARSGAAPPGATTPKACHSEVPTWIIGVPSMRRELICLEPASPPRLQVRNGELPRPGRGQVLVRVEATSVNPIDARRAGGYGRRLLGAQGRGALSARARQRPRRPRRVGRPGRVDASRRGSASTAWWAPARPAARTRRMSWCRKSLLLAAPDGADAASLAVLPYSFTTMWLALRGAQLSAANAAGKRVLVHGAAGALGRLALQLLQRLGLPRSPRSAMSARRDECRALGAEARGRARAERHRIAAGGLRRRAELRELGRRTRARVAPGQRRARPRDHGASAARQLRQAGLGARRARQPRATRRRCARPCSSDRRARATPGRSSSPTPRRSPRWTSACASAGCRCRWACSVPLEKADRRVRARRRGQARPCRAAALKPPAANEDEAMNGIAGMADVLAIERRAPTAARQHLRDDRRAPPRRSPEAPALSFFLRAQDHERPETWNYADAVRAHHGDRQLLPRPGRRQGRRRSPSCCRTCRETHLTIWGGQAAGIVFAINPMLEPAAIGELLRAGGAKVLVTLAPFPGTDLWAKLQPVHRRGAEPAASGAGRPGRAPAGRGGRRTFRRAS